MLYAISTNGIYLDLVEATPEQIAELHYLCIQIKGHELEVVNGLSSCIPLRAEKIIENEKKTLKEKQEREEEERQQQVDKELRESL